MPQATEVGKYGGSSPNTGYLALVAVGSNMPFGNMDPSEMVNSVCIEIARKVGVIRAKSLLYHTPAFPAGSGPDYVNAAFSVMTDLTPAELLDCLHKVETQFGRLRRARWAARTLDLDLISYEDQVLPDVSTFQRWSGLGLAEQQESTPEQLILPHPRMHERAFVLVPLADVAPDWVHPVYGKTVAQMVAALPKSALEEVQAL
ncbi:MAG: 2-amino-4-hydroxy-6-hydroxymethyldihydropteridine diphosphokinase [Roseobacter sp.]